MGTTNKLSRDFSQLTPQTAYRFYLRSFDAAGNYSPNSEILTITTLEPRTAEELAIERQGGVAAFLVMSNVPENVGVGQSFPGKLKVTVADAGGKVVRGYRKAVFFSSSDGLARLAFSEAHPYTFTLQDGGVHEFKGEDFVLNSSGKQSVSLSDYALQSTATVKVASGAAAALKRSSTYIQGVLSNPTNVSKINLTLAGLIAGVMVMPVLVNAFVNLSNFFPQLIYGLSHFFQILGLSRRRKTWGVVFNSQTGQPIPLAMVKLIEKHNRVKELAISDREGKYGFSFHQGTFRLRVSRADFHFPAEIHSSSYYERVYTGSEIKIAEPKQSISFNIPLEPHATAGRIHLWGWLIHLNRFVQKIRLPLLILGVIFALAMTSTGFQPTYLLFLIFCLLAIFLILWQARGQTLAAGQVLDVYDRKVSGAIIRIYHQKDNRLFNTDVSLKDGRFGFKVPPGIYYLVATKPKYVDFKSHLIYLEKKKKKEAISEVNIKLKKVS